MAIKPSILANSYVKFVRTTTSFWNNLLNKDPDTLYFIVDEGKTNGSLYLGNALIATSIDEGLNIEDLNNVLVSNLLDGQILISNEEGEWVNRTLTDFMPVTMTGASDSEDGLGGLVPMPSKGDNKLFLRGDGEWASPTAELETTVGNLSSQVDDIDSQLAAVIGSDLNTSMRDVAKDEAAKAMALVVDSAPEAFDTLKEIAAWIAGEDGEVAVSAEELITQVSALNNVVFDQTDESGNNVPGLVSRVATLEENLEDLTTEVSNLAGIIGDEGNGLVKDVADNTAAIEDNASEITKLWDALKWNELVEE